VDLRIEDAPTPLVEMRRLLVLHRAYERMNRGDEAMAAGKLDDALREYASAESMVPGNDEFVFWHAVTLAGVDKLEEALPVFARAFRMNPSWMLLVPRLVQVKQLPATPGLVERILAVGPQP
jgi:tetratricopeptide (TPR) repeat protein